MENHSWIKEFPGSITVCDREGIILAMNDKSALTFEEQGGATLIGQNVLDCHPEQARAKLKAMIDGQQKNIYTIEKKGVKKLVYQVPWYRDGAYAGFVEVILEIPEQMPHFIRG
ncbi:MAG: diguanylate cyclase [Chloroflexota bacterium]|nr:MAG: diguanylate cyclase [Chloroflexota bacterium]